VLASASGGCFVTLLPEYHILGREPAYLNQKLARSASLRAPVEQAAVRPRSPLSSAGWRTYVLLAPLFDTPVLASTTFWSIPLRVRDILIVLCPHGSISFSGFLDETSET
jgi:hypothetical protein